MTHEQFCFWLDGFIESNPEIDDAKRRSIQEHLRLTMKKEIMGFTLPEPKKREELQFKAKLERLL